VGTAQNGAAVNAADCLGQWALPPATDTLTVTSGATITVSIAQPWAFSIIPLQMRYEAAADWSATGRTDNSLALSIHCSADTGTCTFTAPGPGEWVINAYVDAIDGNGGSLEGGFNWRIDVVP
jgi:hypothetical protein